VHIHYSPLRCLGWAETSSPCLSNWRFLLVGISQFG
jgi:hypothetical protein